MLSFYSDFLSPVKALAFLLVTVPCVVYPRLLDYIFALLHPCFKTTLPCAEHSESSREQTRVTSRRGEEREEQRELKAGGAEDDGGGDTRQADHLQ